MNGSVSRVAVMTNVQSRKGSSPTRNLSFHGAASTMLFCNQFFGMFPMKNLRSPDEMKLKFSWKSPRTWYAMAFLIAGTIESSLAIRRLLRFGFSMQFAEGLFFFVLSMTRAVLVFFVNLKWKKIICYWKKCEKSFLYYPYAETEWNLKKKCRLIYAYSLIQLLGEFSYPINFFPL